jgi:hypothetical protein
MMTAQRVVCLRLVDPDLEGRWMVVEADRAPQYLIGRQGVTMAMVPTGAVEWEGSHCAEVWVPEDKLSLWRMEHDVDR